jgi:uncharacterized protein (DUF2164 family)
MAIEISPQKEVQKVSGANIVLYIVLALFLVFVLSYLGLIFYNQKIEKEISEVTNALKRTPDEAALEERVFALKKRIEDVKPLFLQHKLPRSLFEFLEQNTLPKVWFSKVDFDFENSVAKLSGKTDNFEFLGQQIMVFEKKEVIKKVQLSDITLLKEGGIGFNIELNFVPTTFNR